jgi:hypothetical protein
VKAYNFNLAKDYSILKNARYLLLSNSSFTYFPTFTSDEKQYIIAPKYWARHNTSDGFWASEQNIYEGFNYMDRQGRVFTPAECRAELEGYKRTSHRYAQLNVRPHGMRLKLYTLRADAAYRCYRGRRLWNGAVRHIRRAL